MEKTFLDKIERAKKGDKDALSTLTKENMPLVFSIAKRYFQRRTDQSEDLLQIGAIGLIKAIKNFDASLGYEFSTYAFSLISGEIKRYLRDDSIIRVSRGQKELSQKVKNAMEELLKKGDSPTLCDVAKYLGKDLYEVTEALCATSPVESIFAEKEGDEYTLPVCEESKEEEILLKIATSDAIEKLPAKEKKIIILRYYKSKTQKEIAEVFGISQVQVSRIEKKALSNLKTFLKDAL